MDEVYFPITMMDLKPRDPGSSSTQNIVQPEETGNESAPEPLSKSVNLSSILKGLFLSFLSGVFYSMCALLVKFMKNMHPGQIVLYRCIATFAFSLPQAVSCQENILGPRGMRFLLILQGIFAATNIYLNFLAFQFLPLGEAAVIIFSVPVFVTMTSRVVLKENCGIFQSITLLITVVGTIFITKVPETLAGTSVYYTQERIYGLVASFASQVFNTGQYILLRKVRSVHHSISLFNFGWVAILETSILTAVVGNYSLHRCGIQQGLLILLGILSYISIALIAMSMQLEQAGPSATMRAASCIVFNFVWQTFIFHDTPDVFSVVGAAFLGLSIFLMGLRKWVASLPSESAAAKHLKFLTV